MPTKDGLTNDHPLPLFLAEHAGTQAVGYRESLGQSRYLVANPQDEYFGCNGDSDRCRGYIGRKSSRAPCERHGFAVRHIGVAAWHRSIDANNSINRRHSGFAADCKGRAAN